MPISRVTWTDDSGGGTDGTIINNAQLQAIYDSIEANTLWFVNDSANAQMTIGITLNQGANGDEILALKSSSVAHGMTSRTETDTYAYFKKMSAGLGGVLLAGYTSGSTGVQLWGNVTTDTSVRSTGAVAATMIDNETRSGNTTTTMSANTNMVCFRTNGITRQIFDSDGDSHQDVGTTWTNYDDHDDLAILDAAAICLAREGDPLREHFVRFCEDNRRVLESLPGKPLVAFNEDGHHFLNVSRLVMLLTGAVRQIGRELALTKAELKALRA